MPQQKKPLPAPDAGGIGMEFVLPLMSVRWQLLVEWMLGVAWTSIWIWLAPRLCAAGAPVE